MKAKGKIREVFDPVAQKLVWMEYPTTLEEAIKEDVAKYWPMTPCPVHGDRSVIFRISGLPGCCVHNAATAAYNEAVSKSEPTGMLQAKEAGLNYYWSPKAHNLCGHPGKTLFNGKCAFCQVLKENSPRQAAVREGKIWYMPESTDPCPNGHVAPRRVNNGSCQECERLKAGSQRPREQHQLYQEQPNMIISRNDARALGLKWYRTGEACHAGHTGWRYVSTAGCIECKKG